MDIICRWRDAITDPPPFLWQGLAMDADDKIRFVMRRSDDYINYVGMLALPSKWLDITDVPAVPLVKVQAAVDYMSDVEAQEDGGADFAYQDCIDAVEHHTGVTPSEVSNEH